MWTVLLAILITSPAMAEAEKQPVVYASCSCEVINSDGIVVSPSEFTGSPLPVATGFFDVHGVGSLKTEYERDNCSELESGKLSMACAVAAVKAQHNAEYKCGQIARSYNPDAIDGFQNGSVIPGSCILSWGVEDKLEKWTFKKFLQGLNPF